MMCNKLKKFTQAGHRETFGEVSILVFLSFSSFNQVSMSGIFPKKVWMPFQQIFTRKSPKDRVGLIIQISAPICQLINFYRNWISLTELIILVWIFNIPEKS